MQKIFKCLLTIAISTTLGISVTACHSYDFSGGSRTKPNPPQPVVKDIAYYQDLMTQAKNTVNDFMGNIDAIKQYKDNTDVFPTTADYTRTIAELEAEQASYQAVIYDCQYQILNLQTTGIFNPTQKAQAMLSLQNEITQLQHQLTTKQLYIKDYGQTEISVIQNQITLTKTILQKLLTNKCNFKGGNYLW